MSAPIQIVNGITMTPEGEVSVELGLEETLFDIAGAMEARTELPVDPNHVLAAVILASRVGHVTPLYTLKSDDQELIALLDTHIRVVFDKYGGLVCEDEDLSNES
ncbi:hypothetical protein [Stratiformator vulcanicus]|uniref:Uncharacterized protein n=1 Tax=Stratiformator vulcanicus TaxID=2527980 RepID=A0A517R1L0_9PLAN|nr:hypothetical protein [Stratiformator vulcanicus]QDT37777.1 hypothetical protein Pan189_21590 [Stratiformator vulcanicus]